MSSYPEIDNIGHQHKVHSAADPESRHNLIEKHTHEHQHSHEKHDHEHHHGGGCDHKHDHGHAHDHGNSGSKKDGAKKKENVTCILADENNKTTNKKTSAVLVKLQLVFLTSLFMLVGEVICFFVYRDINAADKSLH